MLSVEVRLSNQTRRTRVQEPCGYLIGRILESCVAPLLEPPCEHALTAIHGGGEAEDSFFRKPGANEDQRPEAHRVDLCMLSLVGTGGD